MLLLHSYFLRRIRRYLYLSIAKPVATALVTNILDYFNSPFHYIAVKDITKLQRVHGKGYEMVFTFYTY